MEEKDKPTKEEVKEMIKTMIDKFDEMPEFVKVLPVTHYDHYSMLVLLLSSLEVDC